MKYIVKYFDEKNAIDLYNADIPFFNNKIIVDNIVYFNTDYSIEGVYNIVSSYGNIKKFKMKNKPVSEYRQTQLPFISTSPAYYGQSPAYEQQSIIPYISQLPSTKL